MPTFHLFGMCFVTQGWSLPWDLEEDDTIWTCISFVKRLPASSPWSHFGEPIMVVRQLTCPASLPHSIVQSYGHL